MHTSFPQSSHKLNQSDKYPANETQKEGYHAVKICRKYGTWVNASIKFG